MARAPKKRVKAGTSKAAAAERRALFVEAYIANGGNATEAAKTAGYSPKTAYSAGGRLLKDVEIAAEVEKRRSQVIITAQEKTQLTADEVIASLARDLRFDPAKLLNEHGTMKPIHEIDEDTRLALRSFEFDELRVDGASVGRTIKVKFPEKTSAREQGMKHFGLYGEDNRQKPAPTAAIIVAADPVEAAKAYQKLIGGG